MLLTKKKKNSLSSKEKLNQKSLYGVSLLLIYIYIYIYPHETKIPASATGGDSLCSSQFRCLILESVNAKGRQGKVEPLNFGKDTQWRLTDANMDDIYNFIYKILVTIIIIYENCVFV